MPRREAGLRAGGAGVERSFVKADCSLLMSKENQKTTSDFDALDPRERGCSPLSAKSFRCSSRENGI